MRPRQSSLGIARLFQLDHPSWLADDGFNEAEAIKPRNP